MNKKYFMVNRNKKCQFFLLIVLTNLIISCNKNFVKFPLFNSNKILPSLLSLPPVEVSMDSSFTIQSISTLDRRYNSEKGLHKIQFMKVDDKYSDSTFNRTVRNLLKLQTEFNFKFIVAKNDSLYKGLITDTFLQNFSHLDMQRVTFNNNVKNGLHVIITNLIRQGESRGIGMGADGTTSALYRSNIIYDFFVIQNGSVMQYSGFSLGRDYSFSQVGGPRLSEMRRVLKNLYKQSEKYYGKNKKE